MISEKKIKQIIEKLIETAKPQKIYLFGSYARGDYKKNSDLDLFIIKDGKHNSIDMTSNVRDLLWGRRFPVDLFVRKSEEVEWNFRAKNPFYLYHIFKDGKVLYEKKKS